jgi:hypothetical protein
LKYATKRSGSWVTEIVKNSGSGGGPTSIALDSSDKVHISYRGGYPDYSLKYATNASGSWITTTVDHNAQYTSIVLITAIK